MAEIPSDIAGSAAQAGYQARETAKEREAARAAQSHSAERQVRSIDEAEVTVETDDDDARVFTDAEGAGSQGRSLDSDEGNEAEEKPTPTPGITRDEDGHVHIDLKA